MVHADREVDPPRWFQRLVITHDRSLRRAMNWRTRYFFCAFDQAFSGSVPAR